MSDFDLIRQAQQQHRTEQRIGQTEVREMPGAIVARYTTAAGQSFASNAVDIVNFGTMAFDPFSLVTTGAAWKFTVNMAGYYGVSAMILWAGTTTWADGEVGQLALYKNNARVSFLDRSDLGAGSTIFKINRGMDTIQLAAGDFIDVRAQQVSGGTLVLLNSAEYNYINIWKL